LSATRLSGGELELSATRHWRKVWFEIIGSNKFESSNSQSSTRWWKWVESL